MSSNCLTSEEKQLITGIHRRALSKVIVEGCMLSTSESIICEKVWLQTQEGLGLEFYPAALADPNSNDARLAVCKRVTIPEVASSDQHTLDSLSAKLKLDTNPVISDINVWQLDGLADLSQMLCLEPADNELATTEPLPAVAQREDIVSFYVDGKVLFSIEAVRAACEMSLWFEEPKQDMFRHLVSWTTRL